MVLHIDNALECIQDVFHPFALIVALFIISLTHTLPNKIELSNINITTDLTSLTHYSLRYMFHITYGLKHSSPPLIFKITFLSYH